MRERPLSADPSSGDLFSADRFSAAPDAAAVGPFPAWLAYPAVPGLRDLDLTLGRFLRQQAPTAPETALRLAVLCSARLAQGHPCLDLTDLCRQWRAGLPEGWRGGPDGDRPDWLPADGHACGQILAQASFVGDGEGDEPLVRHAHRLYLARYWRAAGRIRAGIAQRLDTVTDEAGDPARARAWLNRVFVPGPASRAPDWQRIACANALLHSFSVITGGPGTGKTTTVVRLLAVLQGLAQARGLPGGLRICLAAPTGKAAARLNESIADALGRLREAADAPLRASLERIPVQVVTLHRLLGSRPDTRRPAYDADRPLDLDVLVVDEASMMDVEMTDAVLAALPTRARLVLLGDRDQLASVEAGAVLGELCSRAPGGHYRPDHCARLMDFCGQAPDAQWQDPDGAALDQCVVMLRHSHRFDADSGIGRLAAAVNAQDVAAVTALRKHPLAGLRFLPIRPSGGREASDGWLDEAGILGAEGYPALFQALQQVPPDDAERPQWDAWARAVLACQGHFQVLCALRAGPWGVQGLNRLIESRLRVRGCVPPEAGSWYPGRPVLVTRNQPALGLANGDIGIALPGPPDRRRGGRQTLRVAFGGTGATPVRWISPARLPEIETVYALTVHKSQGSEFDDVVLVLPDRPGPLLTRELLYTGVTRARRSLVLVQPGSDGLLEDAVRHATHRAGGIWDPDA